MVGVAEFGALCKGLNSYPTSFEVRCALYHDHARNFKATMLAVSTASTLQGLGSAGFRLGAVFTTRERVRQVTDTHNLKHTTSQTWKPKP